MGTDYSEMAPRAFGGPSRVDHLGVIGRHRLLVIVVVAWTIGLAALWSYTRPTLYTAEAGILVKPAIASVDSSSVEVNPETESQVMHSTSGATPAATRSACTARTDRSPSPTAPFGPRSSAGRPGRGSRRWRSPAPALARGR